MPNREVEILLVEDSEMDAEVTIRALRKGKVANAIVYLTDGAQAIDFLFCQGEYAGRDVHNRPKLIMLDLKMPKVDGIEVLEKIKSDPILKKIPVVILTSSREHPDVEKCYDLGANSYIVKPVGFDNFMNAINTAGMYWMLINQPPNV
jgi:two-component system response regulator